MSPDPTPSSSELTILAEVIRNVARTHRLRPEEAADFAQTVHLRLLHRNYDVFARFAGRSSLRTYLTVVVVRLLLDWRNSQYGKWRPSRQATRLGRHAVMLERLMSRDALSPAEAVEIVATAHADLPRGEVEALAANVTRAPKPRMVSDEILGERLTSEFADPIEAREKCTAERRLRASLATALRRLSDEDRELVSARYQRTETIQSLSKARAAEPKAMYRRLQQVLDQLRSQLHADGITSLELNW